MKKRILITFMSTLFNLMVCAQQDAAFSMYFFNPMYVNPAYAGSRSDLSGTLVHRSQWVGFDGSPLSQSFNLHGKIPHSRIGLGLQLYNDQSGPMKNTGIQATYAYHIPFGSKTKLSLGLQGSINSLRVAWDEIHIQDQTDAAFMNSASSGMVPDASFGLYLYRPRFYAGASATHLFEPKFNLTSDVPENNLARFYRHYYLTSGLVIPLNERIDFRPSIMAKYAKAAPVDIGLTTSFIFYQRFFVGIGGRTSKRIDINGFDNEFVAILEFDITRYMRIGYSFDAYLNRTGIYNKGTHEIMLGWDLDFTKTKMLSPRFF